MIVKSMSATTHGAEEVVFTHRTKLALTNLVFTRVQGRKRTRLTISHIGLGGN
jgi:hypothetical protein